MKKLMTFAAVAAMTYAGSALVPGVCENCGVDPDSPNGDCPTAVFKVTGSGKAVLAKDGYKTVASLKIKKGGLALLAGDAECSATGECCYQDGYFFATIKVGKSVFEVGTPVNLNEWSVFGKKYDKARNYLDSIKPGKSVCLDSALFVSTDEVRDSAVWEGPIDWDDEDTQVFSFWASAFGKVDMKVTKDGKGGYCNKTKGCDPIYTPKKYSGWFVGWYPCVGQEGCFRCGCEGIDIFGGTWKASFQAKKKTVSAAQALAGTSFALED